MAESGMTALAANASVPREPTVAMLLCGHQMSGCTLGAVWRAMWDAYALASPPSAPAPAASEWEIDHRADALANAVIAGTDHISNLTAALHTEQDRTHRYLARAEQAEAALAAEKRKAEDAREVMRAWWVSDYECYAGRTAQEAFDAAVKDWGGLDGISETVDDVIEAGASETMDLGEDGEGPIVNIRAHAATMTEPGFMCGIDA